MKSFVTVVLSVLLSILAVWVLLPSMQKYYDEKNAEVGDKEQVEVAIEEPVKEAGSDKGAPITTEVIKTGWKVRYSMLNNTNEPIENVKLRFIYYQNGKQIHYEDRTEYCTLEPRLTQSFEHYRPSEVEGKYTLKIQVLAYNVKGLF